MKLFLTQHQSPGDILMLTSAVRDLKKSHPEISVNVSTSAMELWNNNPYLDRQVTASNCDVSMKAEYPLIHTSNAGQHHFIHGFRKFLEDKLKIRIEPGNFCVDIHMSNEEKNDVAWIKESTGKDRGYWLINAGHKLDFTNKYWEHARFQQVVDATKDKITWVQIGAKEHIHVPLQGVVDMRGKTTHRQLIKLMYRAYGVLTPVSYPTLLSTMPTFGFIDRKRPCVVIAGGREPAVWQAFSTHQFLHTCGMLKCCEKGGCWRSRVVALNDNDSKNNSLCLNPVLTPSGQTIPLCMSMITVDMVVGAINNYLNFH